MSVRDITLIETLTTEEILEELFKRHKVIALFIGDYPVVGKEDLLKYQGNPYVCLGMCEHLKALLLKKLVQSSKEEGLEEPEKLE